MWQTLLSETTKPLWKRVGEHALKAVAASILVEGVRAGVDIMKRRKVRQDEYEFNQWKKAQEEQEEAKTKDAEAEIKPKKSTKTKSKSGGSSKGKLKDVLPTDEETEERRLREDDRREEELNEEE